MSTVAKPRRQLMGGWIVDILKRHGPQRRAQLTDKVSKTVGIKRHCSCCTGIHDAYEDLIDDTIDALKKLENDGTVTYDNHTTQWRLTNP